MITRDFLVFNIPPENWAMDPDIYEVMKSPNTWLDAQSARQLRMADTCRKLEPIPPSMARPYRHLLVDDEHKMLYCFIPKAACTSWKFLMLNLTRGNLKILDGASEADGHQFRMYRFVHFDKDLRSLSEYPPEEQDQMLRTYFKFLVVRHPLDRLVSAYRDKFVKRQASFLNEAVQIRILFRSKFSESKKRYVTFEEFVRYVLTTGMRNVTQNQHWATYEDLCQPCFIKYDYIGNLETMEEDSEVILRILGLQNLKLPRLHVQSSASYKDYFLHMKPRYFARAAWYYTVDMEMFGYD